MLPCEGTSNGLCWPLPRRSPSTASHDSGIFIEWPLFGWRIRSSWCHTLMPPLSMNHARVPGQKGSKPDPANMKAFLERHPETGQALTVIKGQPVSSGFANGTFHGLNAFRFINAAGDSTPVRWLLTSMQPFEAASTTSTPQDKNYLFDAPRHPASIHRAVDHHLRQRCRRSVRCES
jgi:hypothetical protein